MVTGLTQASSAPASRAAATAWPSCSPVTSSRFVSSTSAGWPGPTAADAARRPITTWVQFGRSSSSPAPPPKPDAVTTMAGSGPNDEHRAASSAAPVGVVALSGRPARRSGSPRAGARRPAPGWAASRARCARCRVPVATGDALHLVDAEHLERGGRPHDVDDGVVPADLVEVHLVDGPPVQRGLDRGQRAEHGQRPRRHPRRQAASSIRAAMTPWVRTTTSSPADDGRRAGDAAPHALARPAGPSPGRASRSSRARTSSTSAPASMSEPERHVPGDAGEAVEPGHRRRCTVVALVTAAAGRRRRRRRSRCRCRPR